MEETNQELNGAAVFSMRISPNRFKPEGSQHLQPTKACVATKG